MKETKKCKFQPMQVKIRVEGEPDIGWCETEKDISRSKMEIFFIWRLLRRMEYAQAHEYENSQSAGTIIIRYLRSHTVRWFEQRSHYLSDSRGPHGKPHDPGL
jgi:hypothetical protein